MITIAAGCDHHGYDLIKHILSRKEYNGAQLRWIFMGCESSAECDYPHYAQLVVQSILSGQADLGLLACGTGVGMAMAANRHVGVYAAVAWNPTIAQRAREEDACNVLVLPADYVDTSVADKIVAHWLAASFMKGKYQRRIEIIDQPAPRNVRD